MCRPLSHEAAEGAERRPDLAEIVRACGKAFRTRHRLSRAQLRAMRAIETCRTAALGGQRWACDACHAVRTVYHSCRNRHCPKCQTLAQERWLEARRAELLPVPYFHLVFTLPHEINALAQGNPRIVYSLLFRAAASTLQTFAADPRRLGGEIGITAVLHTWGQNLSQHIHLHCIVTGGALASGGTRWIPSRRQFLFPVKALSKMFRGKFLAGLRAAFRKGELRFAGGTARLADPSRFSRFLGTLRERSWVVYAKPPFAGPEPVLAYLARYTHRIALSNRRILGFNGTTVRFRWKDYADRSREKVMELPAEEFLRRFLLHVVPNRFMRVRHFGLLANRYRSRKLDRCRTLLGQTAPPPTPRETAEAIVLRLTGVDLLLCPACGRGRMRVVEALPPGGLGIPEPPMPDTS